MEISIEKIKQQVGKSLSFSLEQQLTVADYGIDDFTLAAPLQLNGSLTNQGGGRYVLAGSYTTLVEQICSRCGEKYQLPLSATVELDFAPQAGESADGETTCWLLNGDIVDPLPPLLSEIAFSLPMQPLCRKDCAGLCPQCGADQNLGSCSCSTERIDPRWEKLAQLKFD